MMQETFDSESLRPVLTLGLGDSRTSGINRIIIQSFAAILDQSGFKTSDCVP